MIRSGECTVGCGACCRSISLQVPEQYADPDCALWLSYHGIRIKRMAGTTFAELQIPCQHLTEDGRCGVYGTPQRPQLCNDFPMVPANLDGIEDVCTYSFIPLEEVAHAR